MIHVIYFFLSFYNVMPNDFFLSTFGPHLEVLRLLFLALHSENTSGGAQMTILEAGDRMEVAVALVPHAGFCFKCWGHRQD